MLQSAVSNVIRSPLVDVSGAVGWGLGNNYSPFLALFYDADKAPLRELTGGPHKFNHSILSPQYQLNADGSYTDVGANPAVDTFDGEKWLRSSGAVTNLVGVDMPSSTTGVTVSLNGEYKELTKITSTSSASAHTTFTADGVSRYTFTYAVRAGAGADGSKIVAGVHNGVDGFFPFTPTLISGHIPATMNGGYIEGLSTAADSIITLTSVDPIPAGRKVLYLYPGGSASTELGASVLIKDFILTATPYPVPYVPPGVTQPASNATTTNGCWFTLADGSPVWKALDGDVDGVELCQNRFLDDTSWWELFGAATSTIASGKMNIVSDGSGSGFRTPILPGTYPGARFVVSFDYVCTLGTVKVQDDGGTTFGSFGVGSGRISITVKVNTNSSYIIIQRNSTCNASIDNISIQRIQPQPLTLATRVRMGVGSGDIVGSDVNLVVLAELADGGISSLYMAKKPTDLFRIVRSYDGTTAISPSNSVPWSRGVILRLFTQVNTAGTQFRVGYMIEGTHTAIQWSAWANYDGSFNPSTLYRLMLGYNNAYPMWFNKIAAWKKQATDAAIMEAMS